MKGHIRLHLCCLILPFIALGAQPLRAQGPSIAIYASDRKAAEAGSDHGTFTIRRAGETNFSQLIFYELSGTASNGVDYQQLGGTVQMPAGVLAVSFTVSPIDDSVMEGSETVVVRIIPSPLDCLTCGYDIGKPDVAEVLIDDSQRPRSGLYAINSGRFTACCGFIGQEVGYDVPTEDQTFVRLEIDSQNDTASMSFLANDAQTVLSIPPCPPAQPVFFSFGHGLVFSNRIVFHVDPGPQSYWNYTVSNSADTLRINGSLRIQQLFCADVPDRFGHSNVVATLLPSPPLIESLERQDSVLRFYFTGEPPYDYFVEYAESLPAQWLSLTNFRAKIETIHAVVSDPLTNSAARFYRIRKQHCLCRNENGP